MILLIVINYKQWNNKLDFNSKKLIEQIAISCVHTPDTITYWYLNTCSKTDLDYLQFAKFDFKFSLKIKDLSTIINQDTIYYIPYLFSTSSRIVTA